MIKFELSLSSYGERMCILLWNLYFPQPLYIFQSISIFIKFKFKVLIQLCLYNIGVRGIISLQLYSKNHLRQNYPCHPKMWGLNVSFANKRSTKAIRVGILKNSIQCVMFHVRWIINRNASFVNVLSLKNIFAGTLISFMSSSLNII